MDVKISGLSRELMDVPLSRPKRSNPHSSSFKKLDRPREEVSPLARNHAIKIDPEKIDIVIGPSGKVIKGIQEETGATIEIEDTGTITIWGKDNESATAARAHRDVDSGCRSGFYLQRQGRFHQGFRLFRRSASWTRRSCSRF